MTLRSRLLPWLQGACPLLLLAASAVSVGAPDDDAVVAAKTREDRQFMELLEFIGEFTTEDGTFVDPGQLERQKDTTRQDGKSDGKDNEHKGLILKDLSLKFLSLGKNRIP